MRSRGTELAAGLVCLLAALACEQVFGLDEYELAPGAQSAAGGAAAGAGGGSAGAPAGGAGGQPVPADCCIDALPPEGWAYVQMNVTSFGGVPPACGGMPETTFSGPPSHASCPACACTPGSATCTPTLFCSTSSNCGTPTAIGGSCGSIPAAANFCQIQFNLAESGCSPSDPELELPTWESAHHLCGELSLSASPECAPGQLCADTVSARLCVMIEGESDVCPETFETERFLTYRDATDTRTCSDCGCGPPSGGSCGGNAQFDIFHSAGICDASLFCIGGCEHTTISGTSCQSIAGAEDPVRAQVEGAATGVHGDCAPSGGDPSGSFAPEEPVTVCCR